MIINKYFHAQKIVDSQQSSHSIEEMHWTPGRGRSILGFGEGKDRAHHPVPGVDSLIARPNELCPSNWDIRPSSNQYIEEIGVMVFVQAASMDPATTTGVASGPEITEP